MKRITALLLSFIMIVNMFPLQAFAQEKETALRPEIMEQIEQTDVMLPEKEDENESLTEQETTVEPELPEEETVVEEQTLEETPELSEQPQQTPQPDKTPAPPQDVEQLPANSPEPVETPAPVEPEQPQETPVTDVIIPPREETPAPDITDPPQVELPDEQEEIPEDITTDAITGYTWSLNHGVLTISGKGAMPDYKEGKAPWYKDKSGNITKDDIIHIEIEKGITHIGDYAFYNLTNLDTVSFPSTLESIGDYAFRYATLEEVTNLPSSLETMGEDVFSNCSLLKKAIIPDSVTEMGMSVFWKCTSLTDVTLSEGMTYLPAYTFSYCAALESLDIPDGYTMLGGYSISQTNSLKNVTLPDTITTFANGVFHDSGIEKFTLPSGVKEIPDYTFQEAVNLKEIIIPEGVTTIGRWAFIECESLERVVLPSSLKKIGEQAFYNCNSLKKVETNFKTALTGNAIGNNVFALCPELKTAGGEDSNVVLNGTKIPAKLFMNSELETVEIPDDTEYIGGGAFARCKELTKVTIPASLEECGAESITELHIVDAPNPEVDTYAAGPFTGCTKLTTAGPSYYTGDYDIEYGHRDIIPRYLFMNSELETIKFGGSIEKIAKGAFQGSKKITEATLPRDLVEISNYAFAECTGLEKIKAYDDLEEIEEFAFMDCENLEEAYLPAEVLDAGAFYNCESLTSAGTTEDNVDSALELGEITEIQSETFAECSSLEEVRLASTVKNINNRAFRNCTSLKTVIFPEKLKSIGEEAFKNTALDTIYLPACEEIQEEAFFGCKKLKTIYLTDSLEEAYTCAFDSRYIEDIYFDGTEEEWNRIKFVECKESNFTAAEDITYHFDAKFGPEKVEVKYQDGDSIEDDEIIVNYYGRLEYITVRALVKGSGDFEEFPKASSKDSDIAAVEKGDSAGEYLITAKEPGKTTITFKSVDDRDIYKTITVKVVKMADDATFEMNGKLNMVGEYNVAKGKPISPVVEWDNGKAWPTVKYSLSADSTGATINEKTGKLTATEAGKGTVIFTATNPYGDIITCSADYRAYGSAVSSITLSDTNVTLDNLREKTEYILTAHSSTPDSCDEFEFTATKSNDYEVDVIDANTVRITLTGASGKITVTATATDGSKKTAKCTVTAGVIIDSLAVSSTLVQTEDGEYILAAGKSAKLNATIMPATPTNKKLVWYSSDTSVATVKDGTVKAVSDGVATITAQTTDGTEITADIKVKVTTPASTVVLTDENGTAKTVKAHMLNDVSGTVQLLTEVRAKGGVTENVFQKVKWTVGGTNKKYVTDLGNGMFEFTRPGKFTVTATSMDGTAKKTTITINVQQHVYDFTVNPPKNMAADGNVWVVPVGTTITPAVVYNGGIKTYTPAAEYKKYIITTEDESLVINKTGTTVKPTRAGESFDIAITNPDSGISHTITLQVVAKNSVNMRTLFLQLPANIKDARAVSAGTQPQLKAYLNGLTKLTGTVAQWTVEPLTEENTGNATVNKTGKLDLRKAQQGDKYRVTLLLTDKANRENFKEVYIDITITAKPVAADIDLIDADGISITSPLQNFKPDGASKEFTLSTTEYSAGGYTLTNSSAKVLKTEQTGTDSWRITPCGAGTATLTLSANDGSGVKKAIKIKVTAVNNPVKSISFTAKTLYMDYKTPVETAYKLTGKTTESITRPHVQWQISDKSVLRFVNGTDVMVTDSESGTISLYPQHKAGTVTITGKAMDGSGKTVKLTINVVEPASGNVAQKISLRAPATAATAGVTGMTMLTWGKSMQMITSFSPSLNKNKTVIYTVVALNDEKQPAGETPAGVTVKSGKVTVAKKSKTVTPYTGWIRVTAELNYNSWDGTDFAPVSASRDIYIRQPAVSTVIRDVDGSAVTSVKLYSGQSMRLTSEFKYTDTSPETLPAYRNTKWTSSDKNVATVSATGYVKVSPAAKTGKTCTITAAALDGSGKKATLKITVIAKPAVKVTGEHISRELRAQALEKPVDTMVKLTDGIDLYRAAHNPDTHRFMMFRANRQVENFRFFKVITDYSKKPYYTQGETLFTYDKLSEDHSLVVQLSLHEFTPFYGFSYTDEKGNTQRFEIIASGKDGSLIFTPF